MSKAVKHVGFRGSREKMTLNQALDSFVSKIGFDPDTGCWPWMGTRASTGYGRLDLPKVLVRILGRRSIGAHQFSTLLFTGRYASAKDGTHTDHLCRRTECVNPAHLEVVTPETNQRRMWASRDRGAQRGACLRGHDWSPWNTKWVRTYGRRWRQCRACAYVVKHGREPPLRLTGDLPEPFPVRPDEIREIEDAERERFLSTTRRLAIREIF